MAAWASGVALKVCQLSIENFRGVKTATSARWHPGRHHPKGQPSSRIGENPPYGMIGRIEETSASCEARYAPRSYPTFLSEGCQHLDSQDGALQRYHYSLNRLPASRLLLPRSGLERGDFVHWPKCEVPPGSELACLPGNTGSDSSCAKAREVFQN